MTTTASMVPATSTRRPTAVSDSSIYETLMQRMREHLAAPASRQTESVPERFRRLSDEWRKATMVLSSTSQISSHPAYLGIIALGPTVVPLILRELKERPGHWSPALSAITGVVPYPASVRGNIRAISQAWIEWGRARGLVT
jgi:hypothetical protein